MKERKILTIQMAIFFLIIFVFFGSIVVTEKLYPLRIPKVQNKITNYINKEYKDILGEIEINETEYKELKYQTKIANKNNSNYYFYVYYQNKNITNTYEEDYLKGKSIINYQEKIIEKNIEKKTKKKYKVNIDNSLDNFTDDIKEKFINTTTPEKISVYNVEATLNIKDYNSDSIYSSINSFIISFDTKKIYPKDYTFIITNTKDKTKAFKLKNITTKDLEKYDLKSIINDIIENNKKELLDTNIDYEYLN